MSSDALESLRLPVQYDSFILRSWRSAGGETWRWMIENIMTGERHTFTDLPELVIFLRDAAHTQEARRRLQQPGHRHPSASLLLLPYSAEE